MIKKIKSFKNYNKTPSISFYNKHLINSIDITNDSDKNNNIINNTYNNSSNNPIKNIKTFNKTKKDLLLAKLDMTNLRKKNKNKLEDKKKINKTINYDESEGLLMAAKLSSSFMTDKICYDSHIYYPKKKIRHKNENDNLYNNNNTKEKTSYISDNDIFDVFPLERYNRQMDEQISASIKIQSAWRRYEAKKLFVKMKLNIFINLLNKYINNCIYKIIKETFNTILYIKNNKKKVYHRKKPERNKYLSNKEITKSLNAFRINELQIEEKINEITILDDKNKKKGKRENSYDKKFSKNGWIKLPFSIEKYVKMQIKILYYKTFLDNFKNLNKEKLKEKQNNLLLKLINMNNIKIIKRYMNRYREKIIIEKTKQNIYYSLIRTKPKFSTSKKITSFFNFQSFYKQNIFKDLVKKYRYTSIVQKYYFLWKKKMLIDNKNKDKDKDKDKESTDQNKDKDKHNEDKDNKENKNKKKKVIKIKRIKKKEKEKKNDKDKDKEPFGFNNCKEDTISNMSGISNNMSFFSNNVSNSIQSINNIKGCLTVGNKKMRIRKITVDHNYYEYIGNNNNYYTNYK